VAVAPDLHAAETIPRGRTAPILPPLETDGE
jgi:hypothetical protein